ncbi:MAG: cyclic nucleotide-binding domain-containing protein [Thermodesulfobacteriota bacterium]
MTYILVNLGYFFMFLALAAKDILLLRSILILGQLSLVSFGYLSDNLYVSFWNVLFFGINSFQIARLLRERTKIELPAELKDLYERVFSSMSRREFLMFWNMGRTERREGDQMIREGEHQRELVLVLSGMFNVVKGSEVIAKLTRGSFIAEMSFLTGDPASADVFANGTVEYIVWNQEKLRNLNQINPQLFIKIQSVLAKDLADKIKAIPDQDKS